MITGGEAHSLFGGWGALAPSAALASQGPLPLASARYVVVMSRASV
jgi:hypothetical protein